MREKKQLGKHKRLLSLLLAIVLMCGMIPIESVLALESETSQETEATTEETGDIEMTGEEPEQSSAPGSEEGSQPEIISESVEETAATAESEETTDSVTYANSIRGMLWVDVFDDIDNGIYAGDGTRQSEEKALADYTVYLYKAEDTSTAVQATTTDTDGKYEFTNIEPGSYVVGVATATVDGTEYLLPLFYLDGTEGDNRFVATYDEEADAYLFAYTAPITVDEDTVVADMDAGMRTRPGIQPMSGTLVGTVATVNLTGLGQLQTEILALTSTPALITDLIITGGSLNTADLDYIWKGTSTGTSLSGSLTGLKHLDMSGTTLQSGLLFPSYQFAYHPALQTVKLPAGQTGATGGSGLFMNCTSLTSVDLSASAATLQTIWGSAFANCTSLTNIDLTVCTNLVSIGNSAFLNCTNITDVGLSGCASLKIIGSDAFKSTSLSGSLDLTGTAITSVGSGSFENCSSLTSVDLSGCTGLTSIGGTAFQNCTNITNVDLSGCTKLTSLSTAVFGYCTKLKSIDMSNCKSMTTLLTAFTGCTALTDVNFFNCTGLTTLQFAFQGCTSLQVVDLSSCINLSSFTGTVFTGCTSLTDVYLTTCPQVALPSTSAGAAAVQTFYDVPNAWIHVPPSLLSLYSSTNATTSKYWSYVSNLYNGGALAVGQDANVRFIGKYQVIEQYYDTNGNELKLQTNGGLFPDGSTYTGPASAQSISGYIFVGYYTDGYNGTTPTTFNPSAALQTTMPVSFQLSSTLSSPDTTNVYYVYGEARTITEHYVDASGASIGMSDTSTEVADGTAYSKAIPAVTGYSPVGYRVGSPTATLQIGTTAYISAVTADQDIYFVYASGYAVMETYVDLSSGTQIDAAGLPDNTVTVVSSYTPAAGTPPTSHLAGSDTYTYLGYKLDSYTPGDTYTSGTPSGVAVTGPRTVYYVYTVLVDVAVSKTVTGAYGDPNQAFVVTVTLQNSSGAPVAGNYTYTGSAISGVTAPANGSIIFNASGQGTITLKHGQTITIKDIPKGYTYTVQETDGAVTGGLYGVTYSGTGTVTGSGSSAVIAETLGTAAATVSITNNRSTVPTTGLNGTNYRPAAAGVLTMLAVAVTMLWSCRRRRKCL